MLTVPPGRAGSNMFLSIKGFEARLENRLKAFADAAQSKCAGATVDHHFGAANTASTITALLAALSACATELTDELRSDLQDIWSASSRRAAARIAAARIAALESDLERLLRLETLNLSPAGKAGALRRAGFVLEEASRGLDPDWKAGDRTGAAPS